MRKVGSRATRTAVILSAVLVCGSGSEHVSAQRVGSDSGADNTPRIQLNQPRDGSSSSTVDVVGLPTADLDALRVARFTPEQWAKLLHVLVAGSQVATTERPAIPPVIGEYTVEADAIRFKPRYPFDPGRHYRVVFDPLRLPKYPKVVAEAWRSHPLIAVVHEPGVDRVPATSVVRVYPTGNEIPENHLRFYVFFSGPMSLMSGTDHVRLLEKEEGQIPHVVEDAFLPLSVALWNADRTRYTLLFDPGRVKRGILPNEQMGRPLVEGKTYNLVIDQAWLDAAGLPLVGSFTRQFRAGAPDERAIDPSKWQVESPVGTTRRPLVVLFSKPLDFALLQRALVVSTVNGERVAGDIDVQAGETRWVFTPREPWTRDEYYLTVLPMLEDPAGNRVGRAFEIGSSEATARHDRETSVTLLFRTR